MMTVQYEAETIAKIEELIEEHYHDEDMYEFIEKYSEYDFVEHYETFVSFGESYGYEVVDAFIDEFGVENIKSFNDAYMGTWESLRDFVVESFLEMHHELSEEILGYLDWDKIQHDWEYDYVFDYSTNTVFFKNF